MYINSNKNNEAIKYIALGLVWVLIHTDNVYKKDYRVKFWPRFKNK